MQEIVLLEKLVLFSFKTSAFLGSMDDQVFFYFWREKEVLDLNNTELMHFY